MKKPRVGTLKEIFELQSETLVAGNDGGASVSQWNAVASFWGRLDTYSEKFGASLYHHITHQVVARCGPTLSFHVGQRLVFEDRLFMIRDVMEINEQQSWIAIYVEEVKYLG